MRNLQKEKRTCKKVALSQDAPRWEKYNRGGKKRVIPTKSPTRGEDAYGGRRKAQHQTTSGETIAAGEKRFNAYHREW